MNTHSNNPKKHPQVQPLIHARMSSLHVVVLLFMAAFCCYGSVEVYEVIEDGQVYYIEVEEEVVMAPQKKKTPDELNESISQKMDEINNRLNNVVDIADKKLKMLDEKQKQRINKELARGKKANQRAKNEKSYKEMGKKKKKNNPQNSQLDAYLIMAPDANDDDEYDPNALSDFDEMLEDLNQALIEAEDELNNMAEIQEQKEEVLRLLNSGSEEEYHQAYQELKEMMDTEWFTHGGYIGYKTFKAIAVLAQGAYDVATCTTRQTIFGMNASTAGIVFAVAVTVCEELAEGAEIFMYVNQADISNAHQECILQIGREHKILIDDISSINGQVVQIQSDANSLGSSLDVLVGQIDIMDDKIDDILVRTGSIETKVDTLTTKVDVMNDQMNLRFDAMETMLNKRLDYIEQLLCTPHGNRPKVR